MGDNRQQLINNQPLMGVAKVGGDTVVKAKAALVVNGAFCRRLDHGGSGKGIELIFPVQQFVVPVRQNLTDWGLHVPTLTPVVE
jgi:hypothetical protein